MGKTIWKNEKITLSDSNVKEMVEMERKVIDRKLEVPYTIMGYTSLLPKFSILLRGESIKKIVSQLKDNEDLRITIGEKSNTITAVSIK